MVEDEQVVYTDPDGKVWHPHRGYWCWKVSSELAQAQERIKELEAQLAEAIKDRNEAERLKIAWFECHLAHQSANQELGRANGELFKRVMDAERRASNFSNLEATPPAPKVTERKDPEAIRAHAARVLERMNQTPHNPKRKLLATQHVNLTNEALRAEGWNEALTAVQEAGE